MLIAEIIAELKPRLQRLGLIDPTTTYYDEDEVSIYVVGAMRFLASRYQLQHFLNINRDFIRTIAGVESYTIPPNYGFKAPQETRRSGFAATNTDSTQIANLLYYEPERFNLLWTDTTGKPAWFTVAGNLMYFQPIPDNVYVIEAIEKVRQEDVPEPYVESVEVQTLWRMASDQAATNERAAKALVTLAPERTEVLRTVVNGEARQRQKFYTSPERVGFGRGYRRWGR